MRKITGLGNDWGIIGNRVLMWTVAAVLVGMVACVARAGGEWLQWGGPNRDFSCPATTGLATNWPTTGPKQLWSRSIGDGYSAIVADGGVIYTLCRRDDDEVVLALNAETGKTVWETQYPSPTKPDMRLDFGAGPISTPLIVGDRIFTVGSTVKFHCLDKNTGKVLWSHDLMEEMGAGHLGRGYGPSPIAYGDTVILALKSEENGVVAFKQDSGEVAWKSTKIQGSYPSPIIAEIGGRDHLVLASRVDRVGLDPKDGSVLWKYTVDEDSAALLSTPMYLGDGLIIYSMAYGGGTRVLKISKSDGVFKAEELWKYRKLQVHHQSFVRIGDFVYASSGDFGPAFLMGIDIRTGALRKVVKDGKERKWRHRGFAKSNLLYADGKLIILAEDGDLAIASLTPEGIEVHSRAKILEHQAWTVPTLVGTKLYVRDRKTIKALDLAAR